MVLKNRNADYILSIGDIGLGYVITSTESVDEQINFNCERVFFSLHHTAYSRLVDKQTGELYYYDYLLNKNKLKKA